MENFATSKVTDEGTIQFLSHDGCINTVQGVRHVSESRYNLISLGVLHRAGFCFSLKGDLMKVFKEVHVMLKTKVSAMCMRNSEVTVGELQLSSASKVMIVEQSKTVMDSSLDFQFYPEERFGLGAQ